MSVYRECLRHERASSCQLLPVSLQLLSLGQLLVILNQLVDLFRDNKWSVNYLRQFDGKCNINWIRGDLVLDIPSEYEGFQAPAILHWLIYKMNNVLLQCPYRLKCSNQAQSDKQNVLMSISTFNGHLILFLSCSVMAQNPFTVLQ